MYLSAFVPSFLYSKFLEAELPGETQAHCNAFDEFSLQFYLYSYWYNRVSLYLDLDSQVFHAALSVHSGPVWGEKNASSYEKVEKPGFLFLK